MPRTHVQIVEDYFKEDIFSFNSTQIRKMQDELLAASFKFHFANCLPYRKYCQGKGVDPSQITSMDDVYKIPLLDSRNALRKRQFFSVPNNQIILNFSSTGSSGKPLVWMGLDQVTIDWMVKATLAFVSEFLPLKPGAALLLLPNIAQLKFANIIQKVFSLMNIKIFFGLKARFHRKSPRPEILPDFDAIREFAKFDSGSKNLVGFPFALLNLRDWMKEQGFSFTLGADGFIITGGGWKPRDPANKYGKLPRKELEQEMVKLFDIPRENIRDFYGATEIMLGVPECVHHKDGEMKKTLHVMPWAYIYAVDPETFEPVPAGDPGIGVVVDFLARAYPGYILTDDVIRIKEEVCPCGRMRQTIEFVERVSDLEERGCAFKIQDQLFSEEYLKDSAVKTPSKRTGLIDYMIENQLEFSGDDIKSYGTAFKNAIKNIIATLEFQVIDDKTFEMVSLGKILCYKKGKPTYMSLDEIERAIPEINREDIRVMLTRLSEIKFVKAKEIDGIEKYYFSKKADEFGEIFFPLLIWAFKYF